MTVTLEFTTTTACTCCAMAIANGEGCDCPPGTHPAPDHAMGEVALGATDCDYCPTPDGADCDPWFSWRPCGVCGSTLGGDRMHATIITRVTTPVQTPSEATP